MARHSLPEGAELYGVGTVYVTHRPAYDPDTFEGGSEYERLGFQRITASSADSFFEQSAPVTLDLLDSRLLTRHGRTKASLLTEQRAAEKHEADLRRGDLPAEVREFLDSLAG